MQLIVLLLALAATSARADYFQLDQQVREEDAARSRAAAAAQDAAYVADHNARLQQVLENFARSHRGYSNLKALGCGDSMCVWKNRYMDNYPEFIQTLTFDTGDGYECYARLYPAGREIGCLHPQTHERIFVDPLGDGRMSFDSPAKKAKHPRHRH